MIEQLKHTDKIKVENYGLYEFLLDLQKAVLQGYELDDSNEGWPQIYGSLYTCLMKPKQQEELVSIMDSVVDGVVSSTTEPLTTTEVPVVMTSFLQSPTEPLDVVTEQPSVVRRGPKPKNTI